MKTNTTNFDLPFRRLCTGIGTTLLAFQVLRMENFLKTPLFHCILVYGIIFSLTSCFGTSSQKLAPSPPSKATLSPTTSRGDPSTTRTVVSATKEQSTTAAVPKAPLSSSSSGGNTSLGVQQKSEKSPKDMVNTFTDTGDDKTKTQRKDDTNSKDGNQQTQLKDDNNIESSLSSSSSDGNTSSGVQQKSEKIPEDMVRNLLDTAKKQSTTAAVPEAPLSNSSSDGNTSSGVQSNTLLEKESEKSPKEMVKNLLDTGADINIQAYKKKQTQRKDNNNNNNNNNNKGSNQRTQLNFIDAFIRHSCGP